MTLTARKLVVVGTIVTILFLANAGAITQWLHDVGLIPWAQHLRNSKGHATSALRLSRFGFLIGAPAVPQLGWVVAISEAWTL